MITGILLFVLYFILSALNKLQEAHKGVEDRVIALETGRTHDRRFIAGVAFLTQILSHFKGVIGL